MATNTVSNSHRLIRKRTSRAVLVAVGPMLGLSLIAAVPANAADVGVVVDTPHGASAKVRSAPSTDASVVDVLRDGTRLPDAECRVRTADTSVWTKLSGDRYIRADLTGYDTRLPMCGATQQVHQSPDSIDRPVTPPAMEPVAMVEIRTELNCAFAPGVSGYMMCKMWNDLGEEQRERARDVAVGCVAMISSDLAYEVTASIISGGSAIAIEVPKMAVECVAGGLAGAGYKVIGLNDVGP